MRSSLDTFQTKRRLLLAGMLSAFASLSLFVRADLSKGLHEFVEIVGLVLILSGVAGRSWAIMYIGGRKSSVIVDLGPYSVTRNPLYVFSILGAAGIGAQSGSVVLSAVLCVTTFLILRTTIEREESHLQERFGAAYAEYRARVPRLLPVPTGYRDASLLQIKPRILYGTVRDSLAFVLAIPAFELIEHAQAAHLLPVLVRLL